MAARPIGYLLPAGTRPFPLFRGVVVTLGREAWNTIIVEDAMASRNHARIDAREKAVRIEDLGSRNGTFVNGKRLAAHEPIELFSDDQVRIGGKVFFFVGSDPGAELGNVALQRAQQFSHMRTLGWDSPYFAEDQKVITKDGLAPAAPPASQTQTAPVTPLPGAMLSGSLGEGGLPQVLQFIHASQLSGKLVVQCGELEGAILFLEGQLYAAQAAGKSGDEAVYALALQRKGRFSFERLEPAQVQQAARNVTENTIKVVFECCRQLDEAQSSSAA